MGKTLYSLSSGYQTQPPKKLETSKLSSVLDFLIFSGSPLYVAKKNEKGELQKLNETFLLVDANEDHIILEANKDTPLHIENSTVEVNFGYKRAKASFDVKVKEIKERQVFLDLPKEITLSNRRTNPRLEVDRALFKNGLKAKVVGQSSIGKFLIQNAQVYEISQFGMSLFVSKEEAVLLPMDKVEEISLELNGRVLLKTHGVINRVDMKRSSSDIPHSYQVVIHFLEKKRVDPTHNRRANRTPILDSKPCFFSAEHPLFPGRKIKGQVFEISSSGLSCILEETPFPVLPGLKFFESQLQLPYCPSRPLAFEIAHVDVRSDGENNKFRLGGEFINGSMELIKDISAYSQSTQNPLVQDLSEADLDLLWSFMFETNFIYPSKRKKIQHQSQEILKTYKRLLASDNPIIKKLVFKESEEIKGHVSSIRFYDNSWIVQHLNALKTDKGQAGAAMVLAIAEFLSDSKAHHRSDIYYTMSFFRPDNLYPQIMFGESTKIMNDPEKAVTYDWEFGVFKDDQPASEIKAGIQVDSTDAIEGLRVHLIERGHHNFLRAIGFGGKNPLQLNISNLYEKYELYRERHVLALTNGDNKAFALVELASPGLNLSELTNSVYIFSEGSNVEIRRDLAENLVEFAATAYFDPRGMSTIVLLPKGEEHLSNVSWEKVYTLWCLSEHAVAEFKQVAEKIVANFKWYIAQQISRQKDAGASGNAELNGAESNSRERSSA